MVKVLFVTERWFPQGGGGEIYYQNLASFLAKKGHDVHVLTGVSPPPLKEQSHSFKSLLRLPANYTPDERFYFSNLLRRIFFILKLLRKTIFLIRKNNIDLIHTSTPLLSTLLYFAIYFLRRPLIASNRVFFLYNWQKITQNYLKSKLFEIIELISYKLPYSCLISVSANFIELIRRYGVKTSIVHIPNAVDFKVFNPHIGSKKVKEKYLPSDESYLVSFIGRLVPQKGIELHIKAIQYVNNFVKNCTYLLIGEGSHRKELEDLVTRLNIKNVVFTGTVPYSQIPEFISASDIIVLPSVAEGVSRVLLEAMACGKPVITTKLIGTKELITDGKTGILIEEGNIQQMSEALISLLKDKILRERIGRTAYEYIKDKLTWDHVGNETLKVYNQVLSTERSKY